MYLPWAHLTCKTVYNIQPKIVSCAYRKYMSANPNVLSLLYSLCIFKQEASP